VPSVYRQISVHLELIRPDTVTVLVTGAVTTPGLVQLPRTQRNLLYAIAGAGGASNIASGEVTLRSLRNPSQEATFNLLQPAQLQEALAMEPLQNGDIVTVQAAPPNAIFIGGLVMAPHVQVNPPGTQMNVLQALASAGGLRTDVTPTELTLIRHMPDGKDLHVKLDVERIQKGKDPNFNLAPGDILWAPDTLLTRAENWVNQNIFIRGGFTAVATYNVTGLDFMNNNAKQSALGINNVSLENTFDPFGFLIRQQQLSGIQNQLPAPQ
jgi:protein involved in polysaccharide export with SLBB domain